MNTSDNLEVWILEWADGTMETVSGTHQYCWAACFKCLSAVRIA